jgi:hypothetical protein
MFFRDTRLGKGWMLVLVRCPDITKMFKVIVFVKYICSSLNLCELKKSDEKLLFMRISMMIDDG